MAGIPEEVNGARVVVRRSRRRRKTISLTVRPDHSIVLGAPAHVPEIFLEDFFRSRLPWIREKLKNSPAAFEDIFQKPVSRAFIAQCRDQARLHLEEKIAHFGDRLGVRPKTVRINGARSRWGSCSADNNLNFPWRIAMLPPALIDYIVVHELAHIIEKNHGPRFWKIVAGIFPDFKNLRAWLRKNSHLYHP